MRTTDLVIRLHGDAPKLEIGKPENYDAFYRAVQHAIGNGTVDIVHKGDYFRYDQHLLPKDPDRFTTYVLFRELTLHDSEDMDAILSKLQDEIGYLDFPEIREHNASHQLIELSSLADYEKDFTLERESEDILVRIAGSREELEFDPAGAEGNTILYDKLTKLIYDKDAEIMYKGPHLIFEDNPDLFLNPDDFSIYVLFRSPRSSDYDDNELLWSHLENDLRANASVSLLRIADRYQVLLFTPAENNI